MVFAGVIVLLLNMGRRIYLGVTEDLFGGSYFRLAVRFLLGQFQEGNCIYLMSALFLVLQLLNLFP